MFRFIFRILGYIIIPFLTIVQTLKNLDAKRLKQPLYRFKSQYFYKRIGKFETEFLKVQKKAGNKSGPKDNKKDITIVLIPGNPGYVQFYDLYLNQLSEKLDNQYNIYAVCHYGHIGKDARMKQYQQETESKSKSPHISSHSLLRQNRSLSLSNKNNPNSPLKQNLDDIRKSRSLSLNYFSLNNLRRSFESFQNKNLNSPSYEQKSLNSSYSNLNKENSLNNLDSIQNFDNKKKGSIFKRFKMSDDLQEQIDHKEEFMRYLIHKHPETQFVFISHAIGSYITLNLLDRLPREKILHSFNIFPLLEKMNEVPYYRMINIITKFPIKYVFSYAAYFLQYLPNVAKRIITQIVLEGCNQYEPIDNIVESVTQQLDYHTVKCFSSLIQSEFRQVRKRQDHLLKKYQNDLTLLYGSSDGWAPPTLFNKIKQDFPSIDAKLDDQGLEHAFVVGGSRRQAEIQANWINDIIKKRFIHNS